MRVRQPTGKRFIKKKKTRITRSTAKLIGQTLALVGSLIALNKAKRKSLQPGGTAHIKDPDEIIITQPNKGAFQVSKDGVNWSDCTSLKNLPPFLYDIRPRPS